MKKKILAMVLSMILGISALGMLAEAADSCPHNNSVFAGYNTYCYCINPIEHGYFSYYIYWCRDCDDYYTEDDEFYVEAHDYRYDYDTGELVCDACGDRYRW